MLNHAQEDFICLPDHDLFFTYSQGLQSQKTGVGLCQLFKLKKNVLENKWSCLELDWVAISNTGDGVESEE